MLSSAHGSPIVLVVQVLNIFLRKSDGVAPYGSVKYRVGIFRDFRPTSGYMCQTIQIGHSYCGTLIGTDIRSIEP